MAYKQKRVRVERGLYRYGNVYWACATPPGSSTVRWQRLGPLGVQQARRERDKFTYELKNHPAQPESQRITLRALSAEWFTDLDELVAADELRPRTVSSYKSGIKLHVLPQWGSRHVSSITADDLVAWHQQQRVAGAAAWSIRARWMALRGLLGHAARKRYISSNPCDILTRRERPKPGRARARYLNELEIASVLEHSSGDAKTINALLIFSGARASELLGLTWQDIDFNQQLIRIRVQMSRNGRRRPLKTDFGRRDVILMSDLARLLKERKLAAAFSRDDDLVIGNGVGRTLGYTRLRKAFAAAASSANVLDATPHTCRHTFASILIDQGASVEFVADQLGHASTKTTWDIYVHLFRARDQAAAAKRELDAAFGHMLRSVSNQPAGE